MSLCFGLNFGLIKNAGVSDIALPSGLDAFAWFDPGVLTGASGSSVSSLVDRINGYDLAQASGALQPTITTRNGRKILRADGTQYLECASFPVPASMTMFIAFIATGVDNAADSIVSMDAASADWQFDANNASQFNGRLNSNFHSVLEVVLNAFPTTEEPDYGEFAMATYAIDADANTAKLIVNNEEKTYSTSDYTGTITTPQSLKLFANRPASNFLSGDCADIIFCNGDKSSMVGDMFNFYTRKYGATGESQP